jgi:hypothetical protein
MTEFEEQVAEALRPAIHYGWCEDTLGGRAEACSHGCQEISKLLAPRVAAAIAAAAGDAADMVRATIAQLTGSWPEHINTAAIYPAALAALRGER